MIRIANFGTFDVENFGDLLFPLIAQKRLSSIGEITAVSAVGGQVWADTMPAISFSSWYDDRSAYDAVIVGGGNIIRHSYTKLDAYADERCSDLLGYAHLWAGSAALSAEQTPVVWNAPGVPDQFAEEHSAFARKAIERTAYLSVRDEESKDCLLKVHPGADVSVVPDSAWQINQLWSRHDLDEEYRNTFLRRGESVPDRAVVFHLNDRYVRPFSVAELGGILDGIARHLNARPVLIAIGPCHGDDQFARLVASTMETSAFVVAPPESLIQVAACLSRACVYVGSSMHGFITAASFGIPAQMVASGSIRKFTGLRALVGEDAIVVDRWNAAADFAHRPDVPQMGKMLALARDRASIALDEHWSKIEGIVLANAAPDRPKSYTMDLDRYYSDALEVLAREYLRANNGLKMGRGPARRSIGARIKKFWNRGRKSV